MPALPPIGVRAPSNLAFWLGRRWLGLVAASSRTADEATQGPAGFRVSSVQPDPDADSSGKYHVERTDRRAET